MQIIGIIGGGQLGRMLALAAYNLGFRIAIYSNEFESPATLVTNDSKIAEYDNESELLKFAERVDILTFEFENVNYRILQQIEKLYPQKLFPNSNALYVSNNRWREKCFLRNLNVRTADFFEINNFEELRKIVVETGLSYILKTTENGYDGRGQFRIQNSFDLVDIETNLDFSQNYILETFVNFKKEASLILARSKDGEINLFPIPENSHREGILRTSMVPNSLSKNVNSEIEKIGIKIANALEYVGVMAIEFFIDGDENVIVNEIAPRVHNSGHFSINSCNISQFEAHIRTISGLPMKEIDLLSPCKMRNLIGEEIDSIDEFFFMESAYPCIYGKQIVKEGRKMGHVNILRPKVVENNSEQSELWNHDLLNSIINNKKE